MLRICLCNYNTVIEMKSCQQQSVGGVRQAHRIAARGHRLTMPSIQSQCPFRAVVAFSKHMRYQKHPCYKHIHCGDMHQWRMGAVRSKHTCCKSTAGRVRTVPKLNMWSVLLHVSGVGSGCGILHKHTHTYAQKEREKAERAREKETYGYVRV
jgi:hypothetical protein